MAQSGKRIASVKEPSAVSMQPVTAILHCGHKRSARPKAKQGRMPGFAASAADWGALEKRSDRVHSAGLVRGMPIGKGARQHQSVTQAAASRASTNIGSGWTFGG